MRYAISVPNFGNCADPAVTIGLAGDVEAGAIADELSSFGVTWRQVSPEMGEPLEAVGDWIRHGPPA